MGGWGYYADQNDVCADEWENVMNAFLKTISNTEKRKKKVTNSKRCVQYIRANPEKWYDVLINCIADLVETKRCAADTECVVVGLCLQTARMFEQPLDEVESYALGFPTRIVRIQNAQTEELPRELPESFPEELCEFARVCCKRLQKRIRHQHADKQELAALREEWELFAQC
jgi:hypothetical protein